MTFQPNEHYRYSLKQGMSGWEVWVIQIALNSAPSKPGLAEDGVFGPATAAAVRELQASLGVTVDAICGPQTQAALCVRECNAVKGVVPGGLLKGVCLGESGGIIPATSTLYPNLSRDYFALQKNLNKPSQAVLREAANVARQAREVAEARRSAYEFFLGQPGAKTQEQAWRLAVLSYNWPAAANQIAAGHGDTWTYTESGTGAKRHLADPAPWVQSYGISGVNTGWDWCRFYINGKVVYVKTWEVS